VCNDEYGICALFYIIDTYELLLDVSPTLLTLHAKLCLEFLQNSSILMKHKKVMKNMTTMSLAGIALPLLEVW
jgi:hypothetical protein